MKELSGVRFALAFVSGLLTALMVIVALNQTVFIVQFMAWTGVIMLAGLTLLFATMRIYVHDTEDVD